MGLPSHPGYELTLPRGLDEIPRCGGTQCSGETLVLLWLFGMVPPGMFALPTVFLLRWKPSGVPWLGQPPGL